MCWRLVSHTFIISPLLFKNIHKKYSTQVCTYSSFLILIPLRHEKPSSCSQASLLDLSRYGWGFNCDNSSLHHKAFWHLKLSLSSYEWLIATTSTNRNSVVIKQKEAPNKRKQNTSLYYNMSTKITCMANVSI